MSDEHNGRSKFDWRPLIFSAALVAAGGAVNWGISSATMAEHTRRIELMEKRMEERSMTRDEYERRHEDLARRVEENRRRLEELERESRRR